VRLVTPTRNETGVSSRLEDLRDLAQLLDEGKITQREFEVVKTELLEAPIEEWADQPFEVEALPVEVEALPSGIPVYSNGGRTDDNTPTEAFAEIPRADAEEEPNTEPEWLVFAKQIPRLYWAAIGAALLTVFVGGTFPPVAWVTAALAVVTLVTVKEESMRWMAWAGVVVGVLFSFLGVFNAGGDGTFDAPPSANTSVGAEEPPEIPVGSLGVEFVDLSEGWNALPDSPFIVKGISTTPEVGALDSFVYRFDEAALLAGAYNPSDGFIYALMSKVGIRHESRSNVFLHLCYLLYPGTQDCFDTYIEESGVYGKTAEELSAADLYSSWVFQGNEWRVEVVDDIETIRVLGPPQTG
jgi:hypothetical protein